MQRKSVGLGLVAAVMTAGAVWATEGGGGAYPNGAEGFMTGALPPPGTYILDYSLWYTADDLVDADGQAIPGEFDLTVVGNIPRLVHVSNTRFLGGLWAQQLFVPLLYVDVTTPDGQTDDNYGMGDLIVDPVILSWHKGNLHYAVGVDVFVPVGDYEQDAIANIGRNYWTFEPVFACSYLKNGFDLSAKFMYDFNLENEDTKVTSGDEFHVDYAAGKTIKGYKVGVGGFYYEQVDDDEYPAGYAGPQYGKGKQVAVGPEVACQAGRVTFIAKCQFEMETENRPEGERYWLKIVAPL